MSSDRLDGSLTLRSRHNTFRLSAPPPPFYLGHRKSTAAAGSAVRELKGVEKDTRDSAHLLPSPSTLWRPNTRGDGEAVINSFCAHIHLCLTPSGTFIENKNNFFSLSLPSKISFEVVFQTRFAMIDIVRR